MRGSEEAATKHRGTPLVLASVKSRGRVPSILLVILRVGHVIRLELDVRRKTTPIAAAKMTSCKQREGSLYFLTNVPLMVQVPISPLVYSHVGINPNLTMS